MANFPLVTGRSTSLLLIGPQGQVVLDQITDWDWKPDTEEVKSVNLTATRNVEYVTIGWSGTFSSEWTPEIDAFFAAQDQNYLSNGVNGYSSMSVYMTQADGSQLAWQLLNVALKFDDAGKFEYDKPAMQKITWSAQSRQAQQ